MDTILPSHPENYKKLIKRSFRLYRLSFTKVIFLAFLLALTVFIPRLFSHLIGQDIFLNLPPLSPHRLWLVLINVAALIFLIAILWRLHCIIHKINEPLADDFRKGIQKLVYVLLTGLIESIIIFAVVLIIYGIQLLVVQKDLLFNYQTISMIITCSVFILELAAIIYISTLFYFLVPLIAVEDIGVMKAIERSVLLVWGNWWRVFAVQVTPWICYLVALVFIRFILQINIHIYFFDQSTHTIWATLLHLALFTLFTPWVTALIMVQLKDLELRKKIASSL